VSTQTGILEEFFFKSIFNFQSIKDRFRVELLDNTKDGKPFSLFLFVK
jgi:hypothetical protein